MKSSNGRNAVVILMIALALLFLHGVFMQCTGFHALHSESNLQSNLLRLHRYFSSSEPCQGVLVGSSISGRLYSEYFRDQGVEVANLGLDGSRPIYSLDLLLDRGVIPKFILIEANTIFWDYTGNDAAITKEIDSPTFRIGSWISPMSPEARPSSVLFSMLKSLQERSGSGIKVERKKDGSNVSVPVPDTYGKALELIRKLGEKGVPMALVSIPAGNSDPQLEHLTKLAKESRVPLITLRDRLPNMGDNLRYSDGLHLVQDSAKQVVNALVDALRQLKIVEGGRQGDSVEKNTLRH
jgi:hypothetical protein